MAAKSKTALGKVKTLRDLQDLHGFLVDTKEGDPLSAVLTNMVVMYYRATGDEDIAKSKAI